MHVLKKHACIFMRTMLFIFICACSWCCVVWYCMQKWQPQALCMQKTNSVISPTVLYTLNFVTKSHAFACNFYLEDAMPMHLSVFSSPLRACEQNKTIVTFPYFFVGVVCGKNKFISPIKYYLASLPIYDQKEKLDKIKKSPNLQIHALNIYVHLYWILFICPILTLILLQRKRFDN